MRRDELEAMGVHLPVLATVALGALPGDGGWAGRLVTAGVDVVASGAAVDTPETVARAVAEVPFRPVKAVAGPGADLGALVAAGARIIETAGAVPDAAYRLGPDEDVIALIDGASDEVEDPNVVARDVVDIARERVPSRLWVVLHARPRRASR